MAFDQVSERIGGMIEALIPGVSVEFEAGTFTLDEAHKSVTLFVDDGVPAPFYEKGAGIQSLVLVGLFWSYCEEFHHGTTLLLLEEPENYLHPHGRRLLVAKLRQFVTGEAASRQVLVSSHSEELVRGVGLEGLNLVRRTARQSEFFRLPTGHRDAPRWRQVLRQSPEIVFARHVLLVEGAEVYIVPALAESLHGAGELDRLNISVIRVDGKEDFRKHVSLCEALQIGWTILTDHDFIGRGIEHFRDRYPDRGADAATQIAGLEPLGIVVNATGDLESLYTADGQSLVRELRKDRAALSIAEGIASGQPADRWLADISPFRRSLDHAIRLAGRAPQ
jgi:putative ATP-dependent endonuclease of the OLD family